MIASRLVTWAAALSVFVLSAVIYKLVPVSAREGLWTHNVLRNWEDFGLFRLKGKLVRNPGGYQALEKPDVYRGHRPLCLYPGFVVEHVFGGAGHNGLVYYLLFTTTIAVSIWLFLGKTPLAFVTAVAVALSPGYTRCTVGYDPLDMPVLIGLPFITLVCHLLAQRGEWRLGHGLALAALVCAYAALNWTTGLVFAGGLAFFIVQPRIAPSRLLLLLLMTCAAFGLVMVGSVLDKMNNVSPTAGSLTVSDFFQAYAFGSRGYMGYPMTWSKALARLIAITFVSLLPLITVFVWQVFNAIRRGAPVGRALLPLAATAGTVLCLRNYFAHHPWMAAPVLIFGIVLAMHPSIWSTAPTIGSTANSQPVRTGPFLLPVFFVVCFIYCCAVVLLLRMNAAGEDSLRSLVQAHTRRPDLIVVSAEGDPALAEDAVRLSELLDRKVMVLSTHSELSHAKEKGRRYLLTSSSEAQAKIEIARSAREEFRAQDVMGGVLEWYRRTIARRVRGDRLETAPVYHLFSF